MTPNSKHWSVKLVEPPVPQKEKILHDSKRAKLLSVLFEAWWEECGLNPADIGENETVRAKAIVNLYNSGHLRLDVDWQEAEDISGI